MLSFAVHAAYAMLSSLRIICSQNLASICFSMDSLVLRALESGRFYEFILDLQGQRVAEDHISLCLSAKTYGIHLQPT